MDIYFKKRRWKQFLFLFAVLIGMGSLFYTNLLVSEISEEEQRRIETWAEVNRLLVMDGGFNFNNREQVDTIEQSIQDNLGVIYTLSARFNNNPEIVKNLNLLKEANFSNLNRIRGIERRVIEEETYKSQVLTLFTQIISSNKVIPLIITNSRDSILFSNNLSRNETSPSYLKRQLEKMKEGEEPLVVNISDQEKQLIYYRESSLLEKLKFYPVLQLLVIMIFIAISYIAFSAARSAEQNMVWIGMAKETAHQLGTPISSLLAWVELLKEANVDPAITTELEKDTMRLEKITERFSKIGSVPELYPTNVVEVIGNSVSYLKNRVSKGIELTFDSRGINELYIPLSGSLFGWVIENLVRNAVDAVERKSGKINISIEELDNTFIVDVKDNGKGISKSQQKTIFQPGFTTKKRGWGLGLSLSKRIIENYHNGKIFVKNSDQKKGTTFRIVLNKKNGHIRKK